MGQISVALKPAGPFRLDLTAWALRRRAHNLVDRWEGGMFSRAVALGSSRALVSATQNGDCLDIQAESTSPLSGRTPFLSRAFDRILGASADLSGFYAMAAGDPRLGDLARKFVGLKPPQFPTVFEALLNGISCQQLTLTVGITLLNRLTSRYGSSVAGRQMFPSPEDVASASPVDLRRLGYSGTKARSILLAARRQTEGRLDLESLREMDDETAMETLLDLPGVGPWTAGYVLLRGLGRWNVFPGGDVGAQNNLTRFLGLKRRPGEAQMGRILERWKPYAGLVYFHLLLDRLSQSGVLT
jgi:DNA-3-methyladenine glycosylase II